MARFSLYPSRKQFAFALAILENKRSESGDLGNYTNRCLQEVRIDAGVASAYFAASALTVLRLSRIIAAVCVIVRSRAKHSITFKIRYRLNLLHLNTLNNYTLKF